MNHRADLLLLAAFVLVASALRASDPGNDVPPPIAALSSPRGGVSAEQAAAMPPELRMAWIAQVQKDAPPAYALTPFGDTGYQAAHSERTLAATFSDDGASVSDGDGHVGLRLARYGYAGNMHEATAARPRALKNRVEYRRGPELSEWYVHGPLGIEHGFTVNSPPNGKRSDELIFEMAVQGDVAPVLSEDGSVLLASTSGGTSVHYRDLYATDATGSLLAARLAVDGPRLSIHVQDAEARYPIVVDPLIWFEQQELTTSDAAAENNFGYAVAVSGDTAVVGTSNDEGLTEAGKAYVFVRSGSSWSQQQKLVASDAAGGDGFGFSVAISGDTAIIGAPGSVVNVSESGSAYVFVRNGTSWSEQQKLTESPLVSQDGFGHSVAISGDTAVIGAFFNSDAGPASGTAYVFVRGGTSWSQQQRLTSSGLAANDQFGVSVAVSDDTALVGAFRDKTVNNSMGSAYVFVRTGSSWNEQQKLTVLDAGPMGQFGISVAVSGDTAVIGANQAGPTGAAYIFARSGSSWNLMQPLIASDTGPMGEFGISVAISGDTAVVGAGFSGAAYVFVRSGFLFSEQQKLTASDAGGDGFGISVAVSGGTALVGQARLFSPDPSGAAHVFVVSPDDDEDQVADVVDNCPTIANPTQDDLDEDGAGDVCDDDDDDDDIIDTTDNCPLVASPDQTDTDGDGDGDLCDDDDDDDGIVDADDNCRVSSNNGQEDADHNGIGDVCEADAQTFYGCGLAGGGAPATGMLWLLLVLPLSRRRRQA